MMDWRRIRHLASGVLLAGSLCSGATVGSIVLLGNADHRGDPVGRLSAHLASEPLAAPGERGSRAIALQAPAARGARAVAMHPATTLRPATVRTSTRVVARPATHATQKKVAAQRPTTVTIVNPATTTKSTKVTKPVTVPTPPTTTPATQVTTAPGDDATHATTGARTTERHHEVEDTRDDHREPLDD